MNVKDILSEIITENSTLSPTFLVDEQRIYKEYIEGIDGVYVLDTVSKIALNKCMAKENVKCLLFENPIDLSAFIASEKVKPLLITPELVLNKVPACRGKVKGEIRLNNEQWKLFLSNFAMICSSLIHREDINEDIIKRELLLHITGEKRTIRETLVDVLNGKLTRGKLVDAELLVIFQKLVSKDLLITLDSILDYKNLFIKVMVTYSNREYGEYGGTSFDDKLLNADDEVIASLAKFIMENAGEMQNKIAELNENYKSIVPDRITYAIPALFIKYIGKHIDDGIEFDIESIWTDEMRSAASFVMEAEKLKSSLAESINYQYGKNDIDTLFLEYKKDFSHIDSSFRRLEAYYEKLGFVPGFYMNEEIHKKMRETKHKYHNVISNHNGRLFEYYNQYVADMHGVIKQSDFIYSRTFQRKTMFIFADGFRYEMARELMDRLQGFEIEDVDVLGELPSETEIGMNSYFIIDEKVELTDKNSFVLKKDNSLVFYIREWRRENLEKKLGCKVIDLEEFKRNLDYDESVIYFFDEADLNMHHFNSATKMSEAINNLEKIIRYAVGREYDVVLLSDHGFVDIEKKIEVQDKSIAAEKKKSRYLILNKNEKAVDTFYDDKFAGAKYLVMGEKKLCFINSTNSLKETSKYNHGGISMQENVITCFIIHGVNKRETSSDIVFENIKASNEITGVIKSAKGYICNIICRTDNIFSTIINEDRFDLHVPVRNIENGAEFLIMVSNGKNTEKVIIKKIGGRVIDKDMDIFS